jgi:FtsP/CotA-like multicopper oxidase with cupredoxin domain
VPDLRERGRAVLARLHLTPARLSLALGIAATLALLVPLAVMWNNSRLPDSYDMAAMGYPDYGGGPHEMPMDGMDMSGMSDMPGTPVKDLVADPDRPADVETTLTVHQDGDRFTVNGTSPGPTLTATVGDMVQVTLVNDNVEDGTTLHWHGVDVPNAMDGVAGVTQDAVMPGEQFVYRFVANHVGTYWYHSHQISHEQVRNGLLGALIVQPEAAPTGVVDQLALLHLYDSEATVNGQKGTVAAEAAPGTQVRLRIVNTNNGVAPVWVSGAPYRVLAVDGYDLNEPTDVEDAKVMVPAGGRYDLGFTVPGGGVRVDFAGVTAMTFGGDPTGGDGATIPEVAVDLLSYGTPASLYFDPTKPDRRFEYSIGRRPGFLDGRPGRWWTINGHLFPDTPMYMVQEGDVVTFEIDNHSGKSHPMHLHGHHAVVLSRDGTPASGSPWWVDSLEVPDGHTYVIAFEADNPGIWMDHCHNLPHAQQGLVSHLMYMGVTSSFLIGGKPGNQPE